MTAAPASTTGCDTEDMRLVHRVFRAIFADGPMLVESVPVGDHERATAVGAHLRELTTSLHNHHRTEDDLLWDTLAERAPACTLHVGLMKQQHGQMAEVLLEADDALPRWMASASEEDRTRVHDVMVRIDQLLVRHLGDEEKLILPVAQKAMTQREWNRLGELARKESKPSMLFPQLGFMLEALGPDEGALFVREHMPAPVRLLWNIIGRGQYRRYRARVYGANA